MTNAISEAEGVVRRNTEEVQAVEISKSLRSFLRTTSLTTRRSLRYNRTRPVPRKLYHALAERSPFQR